MPRQLARPERPCHRIVALGFLLPSLLLFVAPPALGQFGGLPGGMGQPAEPAAVQYGDSRDRVEARVIPERTEVAPGDEVVVAVVFDHAPRWHVYAGDQPLPAQYTKTQIHVEAPADGSLRAHTQFIQWPDFKTIDFFGDQLPVYEGRAIVYVPVTVSEDAQPGEVRLRVRPVFQACDDTMCLMPTPQPRDSAWEAYGDEVVLSVVDAAEAPAAMADPEIFGGFDPAVWELIRTGATGPQVVSFGFFSLDVAGWVGLGLLLLIAMVGGLILNFTPCVLPVIPIKVLSLSQSAGNRSKCFALGGAMSAGVVALWLGIGVAIAFLGAITSTNELFQYPLFTIAVGVVLVLMAVGMCGVFSMRLPDWVYSINPRHDTYTGSFGFGVMTGILALPCTAPFMGAAIAVAAGWQPVMALTVFLAIGVGMALPYLVLTGFPQLIDRLPRSGPGSELLKQVMGLLMLAAAMYFLGVGLSGLLVRPPDPPSLWYWWGVAAMVIVAGAWLIYGVLRITNRPAPRAVFSVIGVLLIATAAYGGNRLTDKGPIEWAYYTPERLQEQLARGNVVVLEFTAEWCLNCKLLERAVLFTPEVTAALRQPGVVPMKIDLTGRNPIGNAKLNAVGRHSIPLLMILRPDGQEVFKEDWYTADQVLTAVKTARQGQAVVVAGE
jgi:thiol:disulfide interchange protein